MRKAFVLPVLGLMAACGMQPDEGDLTTIADAQEEQEHETGSGGEEETPTAREIRAFFYYEPRDCADNSVYITGRVTYADDGSLVDAATCRFQFEDGTEVSGGCSITHSAPTLQNVTMIAIDPVTGATATSIDQVQGPSSYSATVAVTTNDLSLSWDANAVYGDVDGDFGRVTVTIEPSANVIISDPSVLQQFEGTVTVTAPGTYTVTVNAAASIGETGACLATAQSTIEVCHDSDGHEHHVH